MEGGGQLTAEQAALVGARSEPGLVAIRRRSLDGRLLLDEPGLCHKWSGMGGRTPLVRAGKLRNRTARRAETAYEIGKPCAVVGGRPLRGRKWPGNLDACLQRGHSYMGNNEMKGSVHKGALVG